jgi:hypothetical protein
VESLQQRGAPQQLPGKPEGFVKRRQHFDFDDEIKKMLPEDPLFKAND